MIEMNATTSSNAKEGISPPETINTPSFDDIPIDDTISQDGLTLFSNDLNASKKKSSRKMILPATILTLFIVLIVIVATAKFSGVDQIQEVEEEGDLVQGESLVGIVNTVITPSPTPNPVSEQPTFSPAPTFDRWEILGQLSPEDSGESFGMSLSLSSSGDYLAVGAPNAKDNGEDHVIVYKLDRSAGNQWNHHGKPVWEGRDRYRKFGYFVSISSNGSRLAVFGFYGGSIKSAYTIVYEYNSSWDSWSEIKSFESDVGYVKRYTSFAFSGDGQTVVIGGPRVTSGVPSTRVTVYRLDQTQLQAMESTHFTGYDSIALSKMGDVMAVGLPSAYEGAGKVRIFILANGLYMSRTDDIKADYATLEESFGNSVSLSDDGSRMSVTSSKRVAVYYWSGITFQKLGSNIISTSGESPTKAVLSGDGETLVVGYTSYFGGVVKVFEYHYDIEDWVQAGLTMRGISDPNAEGFGSALASTENGKMIGIGAPNFSDDDDSDGENVSLDAGGEVYVYES